MHRLGSELSLGLANLQSLVDGTQRRQGIDAINNNLKVPYSDQFSIGMRNKLGDWNTSAAVARINSKDGFVFTLGNRYPNGAFWMNGGQPWGNGVPGFGTLIIGNNGIETRTTQLLLSAEKPYTRESAGVRRSRTRIPMPHKIGTSGSILVRSGDDPPVSVHHVQRRCEASPGRHRDVSTGRGDFTFAGKLTLATPIPNNGFIFYNYPAAAPNGANNLPAAGVPSGGKSFLFGGPIFGYRSIDLQATKNFDLTHGTSFYLRFDVLNVFNYKNLVDVTTAYPTYFPISL